MEKKEPEQPKANSGTTIRKPKEPELTALEMADDAAWEVKALPERRPGDVILDTYEIENVFSGGMGHVYIAYHNKWKVKLAIKAPNEKMLSQRDTYARILREAGSWTDLSLHPNIAYCYTVRNIEAVPHIFIEYVDGGNLREWIEDGKCIDFRTNLDLAIQFCHGMEYAHSKGMIHRDIKPENVLMTGDGTPKITDFGLVRVQNSTLTIQKDYKRQDDVNDDNVTTVGTIMGSRGYMAPEQYHDPHGVDERADIFSFGIVLFEMFCGAKPYEITFGDKQEVPDPIELSGAKKFPEKLSALLIKTIQWEPEDRYHSFKEVRHKLSEIYKSLFDEKSIYSSIEIVGLEEDSLNNRAVSYLELNRIEMAKENFIQALNIKSDHIEANYNYGLLQWREGKISDIDVINRLNSCAQNPLNNSSRINHLMTLVHRERMDLESAGSMNEDLKDETDNDASIAYERSIGIYHTGTQSTFFLPPGDRVLAAFENCIRIWEVKTGRSLDEIVIQSTVIASMALSASGKYAVFGSEDGTLRLWDLEKRSCIKTMKKHISEIKQIKITPDDKFIVSSDVSRLYCVWELATGDKKHEMFDPDYHYFFSLFPDGRTVAVRYWEQDDKWVRLDLSTGEIIHSFEGHQSRILKVAVIKQGGQVISQDTDNVMKIWDVNSGDCLKEIAIKGLCQAQINDTGQCLITVANEPGTSSDTEVLVWDTDTWQNRKLPDANGYSNFIISYDEKYALSVRGDNFIKVWNLIEGESLKKLFQHKQIKKIKFTQDGQHLLSIGDHSVIIWDAATGSSVDHFHFPDATALDADEDMAIIGKPNGNVEVFEMSTKTQITEFKAHDGQIKYRDSFENNKVEAIEMSPNGAYFITAGRCGGLRVWDRKDFSLIEMLVEEGRELNDYQRLTTRDIYISPDAGSVVAELNFNDTLLGIWNLTKDGGGNLKNLECWNHKFGCLSFSPDHKSLAVSKNPNEIEIYDLLTGLKFQSLVGHRGGICHLSFTHNSECLVSTGTDKSLRIYNSSTGQCLRTIDFAKLYPTVNSTPWLKVALSPDSQSLAVATDFYGYIKVFGFAEPNFKSPNVISVPKDYKKIKDQEQWLNSTLKKAKELYKTGNSLESYKILKALWEDFRFIQRSEIESLYNNLNRIGRKKSVLEIVFQNEIQGKHLGKTVFNERLNKVFKIAAKSHFLIGGLQGAISLFDLEKNKEVKVYDSHKLILRSEITPDSRYMLTTGKDSSGTERDPYQMRVYDQVMGDLLWEKTVVARYDIAVGNGSIYMMTHEGNLNIYDIKTGILSKSLEFKMGYINSFSISSDNHYLVVAHQKSSGKQYPLSIFDLVNDQFIKEKDPQILQYQVSRIDACPQPGLFLIHNHFAADIGVQMLDVNNGKIIWNIENENVRSLSPISDNGRFFLTWGQNQSSNRSNKEKNFNLFMWDAINGQRINTFSNNVTEITYSTMTPDNRFAVSTHRSQFKIWDVEKGHCIKTIEGKAGDFNTCELSHDGKYLATQSTQGSIKIWRIIYDLEFSDPAQ